MPNFPIGLDYTSMYLSVWVCDSPCAIHRALLISISLLAMLRCSRQMAFIRTSPSRQIGGGLFESWGP